MTANFPNSGDFMGKHDNRTSMKMRRKKAQKKLRRYVEAHEHAIRMKAEIMVDHFHEQVIAKQKVDLESPAFKLLEQERQKWSHEDHYRLPGPIQFDGPAADTKPITLQLNSL